MKKVIIYLTLFSLSCAPKAKFISTEMPYPPQPRNFGIVRVFLYPPDKLTYREIGFVIGSGKLLDSWTDIIEKMQTEAALYGANGIILIDREAAINAKKIFPVIEYKKDSFGDSIITKKLTLFNRGLEFSAKNRPPPKLSAKFLTIFKSSKIGSDSIQEIPPPLLRPIKGLSVAIPFLYESSNR